VNTIPHNPDIWKLATEILTTKQLQVLTLREQHGYSWNQISITLNLDRGTVRGHYTAAIRKVYNHLNGNGST
jgi:DNA-directed RNA polymerase specialized sigma24 family protein